MCPFVQVLLAFQNESLKMRRHAVKYTAACGHGRFLSSLLHKPVAPILMGTVERDKKHEVREASGIQQMVRLAGIQFTDSLLKALLPMCCVN